MDLVAVVQSVDLVGITGARRNEMTTTLKAMGQQIAKLENQNLMELMKKEREKLRS